MGSEISRIVAEYESLLAGVGVENSDYSIVLDPPQGVGFFSENDETKRAMEKLHDSESYLEIVTKLENCVAEKFGNKESYYVRRCDFPKFLN
jgi:hypothetical protein